MQTCKERKGSNAWEKKENMVADLLQEDIHKIDTTYKIRWEILEVSSWVEGLI